MKFTIILSVVAAAASFAAADVATQDKVFKAYTSPSFAISSADIQFRHQSNKNAYYGALKTFNNLITPKEFPKTAQPLAIIRPSKANNKGIGQVVKTAKEHGLRVSARSGGYQSGYSSNMAAIDNKKQDFVLVDLSKLNKVKVDPKRRTATAEPGVTGLELYTETIITVSTLLDPTPAV